MAAAKIAAISSPKMPDGNRLTMYQGKIKSGLFRLMLAAMGYSRKNRNNSVSIEKNDGSAEMLRNGMRNHLENHFARIFA